MLLVIGCNSPQLTDDTGDLLATALNSQMILVIGCNSSQLTDDTGDRVQQPSAHR